MNGSRNTWIAVGLCLLVGAAWGTPARADVMTWSSPAGGAWCDAGNWDPHNVPDGADETALLNGTAPWIVSLDCSVWPDQVLFMNPNATFNLSANGITCGVGGFTNHGTILCQGQAGLYGPTQNEADGRVRIDSGARLFFGGGLMRNDGSILVNTSGVGDPAELALGDSDGSDIGGTGAILLQGGGDAARALVSSWQGTTLTQQGAHTVHGNGWITAPMSNAGRVAADVPGEVLRMSGGAVTNAGVLEATGAGILELSGTIFTQEAGGLIRADAGTVRILNATRVVHGTLLTESGGRIEAAGGVSAICDATLIGDLDLLGGTRFIAGYDLLTNDGTITLNPAQVSDDVILTGWQYHNVTLGGTGQVVMRTGGDVYDARMETTGETLINGPLHTIRGEGAITCPFNNHGRVLADAPDRVLRLQSDPKTNDGTLEARDSGVLELMQTNLTQSGAGRLVADGGIVRVANSGIYYGAVGAAPAGRFEFTSGTNGIAESMVSGELDVLGGTRLQVGYDNLTNNGTILINSEQQPEDAVLVGWPNHNVTIGGTGAVVLRTAGDVYDARVETTGETVINGPQHTFRGEGAITCAFTNRGRISADVSDRRLLLVGPGVGNEGLVEARNAGILDLLTVLTQGESGTVLADGGIVRLSNGSVVHGTINTANSGVIRSMPGTNGLYELTNNGDIEVLSGSRVVVGYGALTNHGTITLNPLHEPGGAVLNGCGYCNVDIGGTGELVMCTAGDVSDARIETWGWVIGNGPEHTIRGAGGIYVDLRNQGRLVADEPGHLLLGAGPVTNSGTVEARDGGEARLNSIGPNYWDGGLHGGAWNVYENSTLRLMGASIGTLDASLLLDGPNSNVYNDEGTGDALAPLGAVTQAGRMEIAHGRALSVPGGLENAGTIGVGPGSMLTVPGLYAQSGDATHGVTTVDGTLLSSQPIQINGGVLDGLGRISADLVSAGEVRPGHSPGRLTVEGAYTQNAAGTLVIELAGPSSGQFDVLAVAGQAAIAGGLVVRAIDGFDPPDGSRFDIVVCGARAGEFDTETFELGEDKTATVLYGATAITVLVGESSSVDEPAIGDGDPHPAVPVEMRLWVRSNLGSQSVVFLDLPEPATVHISVFDLNGRRVAMLADEARPAGSHSWAVAGHESGGYRLPAGVYLARADVVNEGRVTTLRSNLVLVR